MLQEHIGMFCYCARKIRILIVENRYQCRLLLATPIAVNASQSVSGTMRFQVNKKYSYDIELEVNLDGTNVHSSNHIRLHDQMYHYMYNSNSATTAAAPGY